MPQLYRTPRITTSTRGHDADGLVEALPMPLSALRRGELMQARPDGRAAGVGSRARLAEVLATGGAAQECRTLDGVVCVF